MSLFERYLTLWVVGNIASHNTLIETATAACTRTDDRAVKQKELTKVVKDQDILINALLAGMPADRIKDRMAQLEARQKQLEKELTKAPASDATLRIHPKIADTYHSRIKSLIARLTEPDNSMEAREQIRSLIEKIVITPVPTGGKRMEPRLHLHGALAGMLKLSLGDHGKPRWKKPIEINRLKKV